MGIDQVRLSDVKAPVINKSNKTCVFLMKNVFSLSAIR
jgi:hypothetical protein